MNIQFIIITEKKDASLPFIKELYELAFSEQKRRNWSSFLSLLKNESAKSSPDFEAMVAALKKLVYLR